MAIRRLWTVPLLLGCLSVGLSADLGAQPAEKAAPALQRKEIDAHINKTLRTVINQGADLYNSGDWAGCYRLYEGALLALKPFLEHYPDLQKDIDAGVLNAARTPQLADRAFVLRDVINKIYKKTAPPETAKAPPVPSPKMPLWDRLGGEKNVGAVVHQFVMDVIRDPKVKFFRRPNVNLDEKQLPDVEKHIVIYISSVTGGPYEYKGKNMREVHKGMGITNAEFDAAAGHLQKALEKYRVKAADIGQLMSIVETTRGDIVQPPKEKLEKEQTTIWLRLGGEAGAARIIDQFVGAAVKDPKVNFFRDPKFVPTAEELISLKTKMIDQLSSLTGGPLLYKGKNMKEAHKGMGITNAEFDACVGHLRKALEDNKVNAADSTAILTKVNEMRKDIVGKRIEQLGPPMPEKSKPGDLEPLSKPPKEDPPEKEKPKE
jgi:truncated hemoglobin YjbI